MYVQPDGGIKLLTGVKLDNTYHDTIQWNTASAQFNWFDSKTFMNFSDQSYTRRSRQSVRLNVNADQLFAVNYMLFNNKRYGGKWFYAFVTSIDYVNEGCCDVNFEIDVLQTWYFDFTMDACYIEREHAATDVAGDNIMTEPVDLGDIKCYGIQKLGFGSNSVCLARAIGSSE